MAAGCADLAAEALLFLSHLMVSDKHGNSAFSLYIYTYIRNRILQYYSIP